MRALAPPCQVALVGESPRPKGAHFYFAKPSHSWERGLNEHTNGLLRQYLPKRTSFAFLKQKHIAILEYLLNNRPRKELKYATPQEAFNYLKRQSHPLGFCEGAA